MGYSIRYAGNPKTFDRLLDAFEVIDGEVPTKRPRRKVWNRQIELTLPIEGGKPGKAFIRDYGGFSSRWRHHRK